MKRLTWTSILPLTIISFALFTKWWFTLPVDAPGTMMYGFPFIWYCDGWHTSLSLQIFILPLLANLAIFFLFWYSSFFLLQRFIVKVSVPKIITILALVFSSFISIGAVWMGSMPEHIYSWKQDFDAQVLTTGYRFIWEPIERPKLQDYKTNIQ